MKINHTTLFSYCDLKLEKLFVLNKLLLNQLSEEITPQLISYFAFFCRRLWINWLQIECRAGMLCAGVFSICTTINVTVCIFDRCCCGLLFKDHYYTIGMTSNNMQTVVFLFFQCNKHFTN